MRRSVRGSSFCGTACSAARSRVRFLPPSAAAVAAEARHQPGDDEQVQSNPSTHSLDLFLDRAAGRPRRVRSSPGPAGGKPRLARGAPRVAARVRATLAVLVLMLVLAPAANASDSERLRDYARGTWASLEAMTDRDSGLPADILESDGSRSVQTSTTNIGAYMWSAVAARRVGFISRRGLVARLSRTLATLEGMERYEDTGQFYNWYDHRTGEKLTTWPPDGTELNPILSSVDNAWLAVGLKVVAESVPALSRRARALYEAMDFGFYYRPEVNRVLFHFRPDDPAASPCCYDTLVSESRIVDYIGIAQGQLPRRTYYGRWRTFPDTLRVLLPGDQAGGRVEPLRGRGRVRGRLPLRRHAARALLGRLDVRGADARPVPARGGLGGPELGREPPADRARADLPRPERGRLRLLGLLAGEQARGRLRRLGSGRRRHGPERHALELRRHAGGPRLPGLPAARSRGQARPAAVGLHQRRGHAARGLPRAALRAARDARQPAPAGARLPRPLRALGLPRQRQRRQRPGLRTPTCRSTRA